MTPVFVYGTLKEGFPNFHINKGIRLKGVFYTKEPYPFYLVGERYSPWLVFIEKEGYRVMGQVFIVDTDTLREMDILEGINEPEGYQKVQISIVSSVDSKEILATAYVKPAEQLKTSNIQLGPLKEYEVTHSLLYRPRTDPMK